MSEPQKRGRGRPPKLDRQAALRDAMTLFWENGYEGTTFDDLIGKMSISPSSFYNAFGSKEQLYREATECFVEGAREWILGSLFEEGVTARAAFSNLFEAAAAQFTKPDTPRGCMVSLSGTHQAASLAPLREMMVDIRAGTETYFAERLRKGISDGDVPGDIDVDAHAAFLHTLLRGLAVQARDGASCEKLVRIAKAGLAGMPGRLDA